MAKTVVISLADGDPTTCPIVQAMKAISINYYDQSCYQAVRTHCAGLIKQMLKIIISEPECSTVFIGNASMSQSVESEFRAGHKPAFIQVLRMLVRILNQYFKAKRINIKVRILSCALSDITEHNLRDGIDSMTDVFAVPTHDEMGHVEPGYLPLFGTQKMKEPDTAQGETAMHLSSAVNSSRFEFALFRYLKRGSRAPNIQLFRDYGDPNGILMTYFQLYYLNAKYIKYCTQAASSADYSDVSLHRIFTGGTSEYIAHLNYWGLNHQHFAVANKTQLTQHQYSPDVMTSSIPRFFPSHIQVDPSWFLRVILWLKTNVRPVSQPTQEQLIRAQPQLKPPFTVAFRVPELTLQAPPSGWEKQLTTAHSSTAVPYCPIIHRIQASAPPKSMLTTPQGSPSYGYDQATAEPLNRIQASAPPKSMLTTPQGPPSYDQAAAEPSTGLPSYRDAMLGWLNEPPPPYTK
tara:strand:- start:10585 stop:11970 length:1386 start_codon:yes stop_codon:yes gene_type:complete